MLFIPPASPGESRCPGGRRCRGILACWPLSVAVIAVNGAVNAVTGDLNAVTRGRNPCAGRERHRAAVTTVVGGLPRNPRADSPGLCCLTH
jgi:hypothetical protein